MRESIESSARKLPLAQDAEDEHGEVINLHRTEFIDALMGDLGRAKVLAYTNKAVIWINAYIREQLFGADAQPFEPGERLVLVETFSDGIYGMLHTETEVNVKTAGRAKLMGLDCWKLNVDYLEGGHFELYTLDAGQRGEYYRRLAKAKDRGKAGAGWGEFYDLKEAFARVRPGWATTIHKSQGSTYDHVYLIQTNVLSTATDPAVRKMLLYVAYSRARKKLILS